MFRFGLLTSTALLLSTLTSSSWAELNFLERPVGNISFDFVGVITKGNPFYQKSDDPLGKQRFAKYILVSYTTDLNIETIGRKRLGQDNEQKMSQIIDTACKDKLPYTDMASSIRRAGKFEPDTIFSGIRIEIKWDSVGSNKEQRFNRFYSKTYELKDGKCDPDKPIMNVRWP